MTPRQASEDDPVKLALLDQAVFFVMQELGPSYQDRRRFRQGLVSTTPEEDRPTYHHPSQPHHYDMQAFLHRTVSSRTVGLSLLEREVVDVHEGGEERKMLPVGEPLLKVVTTDVGSIDFPGESSYLFSMSHHLLIRQNILSTLRMFPNGDEVISRSAQQLTTDVYDQFMDFES